jgi:hypothetical protein
MKKYLNLIIYLTLYFVPAIIFYKVFNSPDFACLWLFLGWIIVLFVVVYLEN